MKSFIIDGVIQTVSNAVNELETALYYAKKEELNDGATLDSVRIAINKLKKLRSDVENCPSGNSKDFNIKIGDVTFNIQS